MPLTDEQLKRLQHLLAHGWTSPSLQKRSLAKSLQGMDDALGTTCPAPPSPLEPLGHGEACPERRLPMRK